MPEAPDKTADPELEALPKPHRPWRRLTLAVMSLTAVSALALLFGLRSEIAYALSFGPPVDLGNLDGFSGGGALGNAWVQGRGALEGEHALRYSRPLDGDEYRLVKLSNNESLWVQVRVPGELEASAYVPPASFVGRLLPLADPGLRYRELPRVARELGGETNVARAWLLVDGEAPATTRWVLGLAGLAMGFFAFNVFGLVQLLGPAKNR